MSEPEHTPLKITAQGEEGEVVLIVPPHLEHLFRTDLRGISIPEPADHPELCEERPNDQP
jgi:hypothetical protein